MATVQTILDAAYLRSSRNVPGKTANTAELIGFLNRVYLAYYLLMAEASPDSFRSEITVVLGGAPPSAVIANNVRDVVYAETAAGAEVTLIPRDETLRLWHVAPCIIWFGNTVRSRGKVGDPVNGDILVLFTLLGASALTSVSDVPDARFSDEYTELLILEVACYLALKDSNRDPSEYAELAKERAAWQARFMAFNGYPTTGLMSPANESVESARHG